MKRRLFNPGRDGSVRDLGLLIMRVGFAAAMIGAHGWGKMMRFGTAAEDFPDPLGIGGGASMALVVFAEVFCAFAVLVGFMGRLASVSLVVTFAVAFFVQHGADPFAKKEKALLFLIAFLGLLATGPGRYSLDATIRSK